MKVVVVGGGIAGLSAAHRLVESNHPGLEVILLEASDRLGGTIRTVEHEGCMLELGPDSFLSSKPWLTQLAERLGVEDQIITTNHIHRRAQVVYRGKLHRLPEGFLVMAPTRVWPMLTTSLFSFTGKIRCAQGVTGDVFWHATPACYRGSFCSAVIWAYLINLIIQANS